jgi:hypothetical protein
MARKTTAPARMEEVEDLEAGPVTPSGLNLEAGLIFVTFLVLLVGLVVAQVALKKYFGVGILA